MIDYPDQRMRELKKGGRLQVLTPDGEVRDIAWTVREAIAQSSSAIETAENHIRYGAYNA